MPKFHITSFLRPRVRYKSIEDQPLTNPPTTTTSSANTQTTAAEPFTFDAPSTSAYAVVNASDTIINITDTTTDNGEHQQEFALIPTLEFVAKQPSITATVGTQHVAVNEVCNICYNTIEIENNSRHTYIIQTNSSDTDLADAIQQQECNFSLLTDISSSSFVDEPTSSISIEMDNLGKITSATNTRTTTSRQTTTTTDGVPATTTTTSNRNSSRSAMTTITTPSSDQSIEEDIEEAIEISEEELPDEGDNSSAAQLREVGVSPKQPSKPTLHSSSDEQIVQRKSSSAASDDQFKIDDEQLSGGELARHFVLDAGDDSEDDDDDVDFDGMDVSLPMEKRLVHSSHLSAEEDHKSESLSNQSTTDDVSDFVEEPRQGTEPEQGESADIEVPIAESTQGSNELEVEISSPVAVNKSSNKVESEAEIGRTTDGNENVHKAVSELLGGSPEHSEKDHSIEELVESNHSIEMTLDDKDLSSLQASFDINHESMVDRLLADTMEEDKELEVPETVVKETIESQQSEEAADIITDLDKSLEIRERDVKKLSALDLEKSTEMLQTSEANIIINKPAKALETLQLMPVETKSIVGAMKLAPIVEKNTNFSINELTGKQNSSATLDVDDFVTTEDEEDDNSLELMKLRILAMKLQPKEQNPLQVVEVSAVNEQSTKPMERVSLSEFSKDVLEDITEESERNSVSTAEEQHSLSLEKSASTTNTESKTLHGELPEGSESVVSLNMLKMLEQKVQDLQQMVDTKDACLAALNLQLENTTHRRESLSGAVSNEQLGSGRDTSSLVTNSTEYRTFQEDFGQPTMDIYMELTKRDELITKLTDSLQQSMNIRENLQAESDKLNTEIQLLRKQLTDAMDTLRKPCWPRDQESNYGQRISEISMDLISESDDDLERHFLTDNEDKYSRNSRERQLSIPKQLEMPQTDADNPEWSQAQFSKQIEQFQKYLTPSEVRLFFMVQKKFDDFLCQELEKCKMKYEQELKTTVEQWENEKQEKEKEIERLQQQQLDKDNMHSKEMEDLRKYFEAKCADLEKQFSDDVFSQKSQHLNAESSSECGSDQDQMPEEAVVRTGTRARSKECSPRKRTRAELLLSPSHRQMTPLGDAYKEDNNKEDGQSSAEMADLKSFYQSKIRELQRANEEQMHKLSDKVKYYETRYPDDEYMSKKLANTALTTASHNLTTSGIADANSSLIIIDQDELNIHNESQVIQKIIEEYERRLQEQVTLAREDIVHALEQQIQTLLSETTTDDHHWPPELILLREKFTAKSQLEIAQLQIKHEEEMSRLKLEYEKQLNRKNKRNIAFDSSRDLEQIICERDNLRELCKSFRHVLAALTKYLLNCEEDLNATLADEVQRLLGANRNVEDAEHTLNISSGGLLNSTFNSNIGARLIPDVHNLLDVVEDPQLLDFVSQSNNEQTIDVFDLEECLVRLKEEATYLLQLSEGLAKRQKETARRESESSGAEKHDSCCESEEGLKKHFVPQQHKFLRTHSFNEQQLCAYQTEETKLVALSQTLNSLPPDLNRLHAGTDDYASTPGGEASELNFQVHELKNRLVKSESDRLKLQQELEHTISRNAELGEELQALRDQLSQLSSLNHTEYAEGYGLGSLKSPPRLSVGEKSSSSFSQLQEKARNLLSTPPQQQGNNDATVTLLQMIEDFCREGDKVVEGSKRDRDDLQSQIDTADKQLKATRQFLEEQAAEREQERDEYLREIERIKSQLRDKEKERNTYAKASEEFEQLESQIRELTQKLHDSNAKREKFEVELKASIDKIFVLREIITELETQVETKALNEHVLGEKVKELENYINTQTRSNETLQNEVQSLKIEIDESYQQRINALEEKLQNMRPTAEQHLVLEQVVEQLRDIENTLDQRTKTLESLHNTSNSCSLSATEDISVHGVRPFASLPTSVTTTVPLPLGSPLHPSPRQHSITMEGVQRIVDKLSKHTRVEEAAIKRIRDLEIQVTQMRTACVELQHERDTLQERMTEQTQRISALQSRLEEQRQRAEELQRAGTSDLNIRIHDLQTELQNVRETLSVRDKQIGTMKQQLEKSKTAIDRLEAQLSIEQQPDRSLIDRLQSEMKQKSAEVQKLKDKIKTEMINKLALPDLMETMLADKNEEIDHLKEQLEYKEKELQELSGSQASSVGEGVVKGAAAKDEASHKLSARTLSDIVSITEFDEPDVARKLVAQQLDTPLVLHEGAVGLLPPQDISKEAVANLTQGRMDDLSGFAPLQPANTFDHPHYFQDPNALLASGKTNATNTPVLVPRQINFSALTEDSKLKTPSMLATPDNRAEKELVEQLKREVEELKQKLELLQQEKEQLMLEKVQEVRSIEDDLVATQLRLGGLQDELEQQEKEMQELTKENDKYKQLQMEMSTKCAEIEELLATQEHLKSANAEQREQLSKHEKNLLNYQQNEERYLQRIAELEAKIVETAADEVATRDSLRKELQAIEEAHKQQLKDADVRKREIERLNEELKAKDERLLHIGEKLLTSEESASVLQQQLGTLEREVEKLRQQLNSENSSKQFSVDEIAQQVEKELNYSAQLDSNILKAIESEEENNLDMQHRHKENQVKAETQGTDDENFTGERDLLNQLEALRVQVSVESEQNEAIRQELLHEKQHSQEMQEQDVIIIEAMRKRLENALEKEDELHKQLDLERERCDRLQAQLTSMQRAESRRNSLMLLKSPTESPRKSARSINEYESELAERLRSEIKLLAAQNEREKDRSADLQRSGDRERQRYETELQERLEYCERLKREMEKLVREKESAEQECEHLQERLTLQTQEIESLESRLATLQEAETRRCSRRERQLKEHTQTMSELQEVKTQLLAAEAERESFTKTIANLRYDVERSAVREAKLAESLAQAHANLKNAVSGESNVPQQFLQKMKEINALLAENTHENRQMAETVQFLVEERQQLQKKCEEMEAHAKVTANVSELEERCNHLLGRYLRVESHRKALVYQKRYLKISLQSYQESEQRAIAAMHGGRVPQTQRNTKRLFKTVALAIVAIQRMKYIGRIWHTGKRIVSKSVFTITQQKRYQPPTISCPVVSSTSAAAAIIGTSPTQLNGNINGIINGPYAYPTPLQTPALYSDCSSAPTSAATTSKSVNSFNWPSVPTQHH